MMLAHHTADRPKGQRGVSNVRNYKHYIKRDKESKVFAAVACLIVLALIAMIILQLCGMFDEPLWKPDMEFPLANANVSWLQSFHGGVF